MPSKGFEQAVHSHSTHLCCVPDLGQAARSSNESKLPRLADGRIPYAYGKRSGEIIGGKKRCVKLIEKSLIVGIKTTWR